MKFSRLIPRAPEHLELSGKWKDYESVVTYGWLRAENGSHLIPLTISTQAEFKKGLLVSRAVHQLRIFTSRGVIAGNEFAKSLPQ